MSSSATNDDSNAVVAHVCRTLRNEFETMRRSLTCSICMSTYVDPVTLSSCVHAFCRTCITQALRSRPQPKCPLCLVSCSRRSLTDAPDLAVAVRCYKTATRAFGLAPATYTSAIPMTQLPASDEPTQVDMVTAHDELLAARTFSKFSGESGYVQQEQRDIVAVNQRFLLQSAVNREPTLSQIRQEAQNQDAADIMHSDASDDDDDDDDEKTKEEASNKTTMPSQAVLDALDQPSPFSSPFAVNCSPVPRNRVREIVDEMERRTSLQQLSSPLVVSSPSTVVVGNLRQGTLSPPLRGQRGHTGTPPSTARLDKPMEEQQEEGVVRTLRHETLSPPLLEEGLQAGTHPCTTRLKEPMDTQEDEGKEQRQHGSSDDGSLLNVTTSSPKISVDKQGSLAQCSDVEEANPAFVEPTPKSSPPKKDGMRMVEESMIEEDEDTKMPYMEPASSGSIRSSSSLQDSTSPAVVEPTPVAASLPSPNERRVRATVVETANSTAPIGTAPLEHQGSSPPTTRNSAEVSTQGPTSAPTALVVDTCIGASSGTSDDFVTPTAAASPFVVGTIVGVQSRTWPGINQPGGVATILAVHNDSATMTTTYDVQYVLDRRKERRVERQYLKLEEAIDSASKGRDSAGSSSSRNQRRKRNHEALPPELLSELQSQGFDITGEQTTRILSARNNNESRGKRKSKEKQSTGKKRHKSPRYGAATTAVATVERPRWTAATKCKKADENYGNLLTKAMKKGVLYVCTSGLSAADEAMLKELARAVKSTNVRLFIADRIQNGKTAICIVPATVAPRSVSHNTFAARRTMKTMQASLLGIPLVSSAWIANCVEKRQVLVPESTLFIRSLPTKRTDTKAHYGVALLATFGRDAPAIFPGLSVYLCGFSQKNATAFRGLLHDAGVDDVIVSKQTAIARVRTLQAPTKLVLLCDHTASDSISEALEEAIIKQQENIAVVDSPWLVDSVSCGFALEPSDYPPKKGKAKALWALTKSKSFTW